MPQKSRFQIDIPLTDILSYAFPQDSLPSDKPVWIDAEDPKRSLSPKQLLQWAKRLGLGLKRLGVRDNEAVMMFSTNHIFVPVAYFGIAGHGYIFTGCNPAYGADEAKFQIENTGAKVILVEPPLLKIALEAADATQFPRDRIFLFSDVECSTTDGIKDWRTMLGSPEEAERWQWRRMNAQESRTRVAVLNYSSGTTGLPKGVMISHENIIANTEQSLYMRRLLPSLELSSSQQPPERWLGFLPLYHAYGQLWSLAAAARTLTPTFMMRSFSYPAWLSNIQRHKITHIQTAPPLLVMLAKRPETKDYDLSSLQNILCGAAPLSRELQNEVSDRLNLKVCQTWGMTELTCSACHVPGLSDSRTGCVGFVDPNCSVKLKSDEGAEIQGPGERGEILVKGPNVCLGYWRNEQATRDAFDEDGYLRTGDVAVRDEQGQYWIVDRKKELIKVRGYQVPPAELEAVLLTHPSVADAAVVGMRVDLEELPRAYLVVRDEDAGKVREDDIKKWMQGKVARHKWLTGGVKFLSEVPKSPSGKIVRKTMKAWAEEDAKEFVSQVKAKL